MSRRSRPIPSLPVAHDLGHHQLVLGLAMPLMPVGRRRRRGRIGLTPTPQVAVAKAA